ncbi:MAG: multidrug efflux SMR transporter [Alphaproteobacteria bacterium]|nr:multidrug efflux SMR transporter [Alphaproteobacteria bacterium]
MAWLVLFAASLLEIVGAIALKHAEGFTRPLPTLVTITAMAGSVGLLGLAVKTLPLGTAYAVWTAVGTLGTVIIGIAVVGEPAGAVRLASIALIVAGVVGLKLAH